jgi:hypothetical protein
LCNETSLKVTRDRNKEREEQTRENRNSNIGFDTQSWRGKQEVEQYKVKQTSISDDFLDFSILKDLHDSFDPETRDSKTIENLKHRFLGNFHEVYQREAFSLSYIVFVSSLKEVYPQEMDIIE